MHHTILLLGLILLAQVLPLPGKGQLQQLYKLYAVSCTAEFVEEKAPMLLGRAVV